LHGVSEEIVSSLLLMVVLLLHTVVDGHLYYVGNVRSGRRFEWCGGDDGK